MQSHGGRWHLSSVEPYVFGNLMDSSCREGKALCGEDIESSLRDWSCMMIGTSSDSVILSDASGTTPARFFS